MRVFEELADVVDGRGGDLGLLEEPDGIDQRAIASTSSRRFTRSVLVLKDGSSFRSSRPMARKSRSVMAWVDAEIATQPPSLVAYTLRGEVPSEALPTRLRTLRESLKMAASGPRIEKIDSNRLRSMTWPRPPLTSTLRTAITVAMASGGSTGSRSSNPLRDAKPDMASTRVPNPGRFAYGPVCPNPDTRTRTSFGLASSRVSGPTPRRSR